MYLLIEERGEKPTKYAYGENKEALIEEAYNRSKSHVEFGGRSWKFLTEEEKEEYRQHCCSAYAYVRVKEVTDFIE